MTLIAKSECSSSIEVDAQKSSSSSTNSCSSSSSFPMMLTLDWSFCSVCSSTTPRVGASLTWLKPKLFSWFVTLLEPEWSDFSPTEALGECMPDLSCLLRRRVRLPPRLGMLRLLVILSLIAAFRFDERMELASALLAYKGSGCST